MKKWSSPKHFSERRALRLALQLWNDHKRVEAQRPPSGKDMLCVQIAYGDRLYGELLLRCCRRWLEFSADSGSESECMRRGIRHDWALVQAGDADRLFEFAQLFFFSSHGKDHEVAQAWCRQCIISYDGRVDPEAHFKLGLMYHCGWGCQEDQERAIALLREAAAAGHADAAYELGVCHWQYGTAAESDHEAARCFRLAAELGSGLVLPFIYSLGACYMMGYELEKELPLARYWFDLAAQLGHPEAMEMMAMPMEDDEELSEAEKERRRYWADHKLRNEKERAQAGDPEAQHLLARRYEYGDGVSADPAMADKWYEEAFRGLLFKVQHDDSDGTAAHSLAQCYRWGQGTAKDCAKAADYFVKAAVAGSITAFNDLAVLLLEQENTAGIRALQVACWIEQARKQGATAEVEMFCNYALRRGSDYEWRKNITEESCRLAIEWYSVAANADDVSAQVCLAQLYESGHCGTPDLGLAEFWYHRAMIQNQRRANAGDPYAQRDLACLYEEGKGVIQDARMAEKWFAKAAETFRTRAEKGDAAAQCELADMFCCGAGVDFDPVEAEKWYQLACARGSEQAEKHYGSFCMKMGCICLGLDESEQARVDRQAAVKWLQKGAKLGNAQAIDALDYVQKQQFAD
jgi:TPR repeat protein